MPYGRRFLGFRFRGTKNQVDSSVVITTRNGGGEDARERGVEAIG